MVDSFRRPGAHHGLRTLSKREACRPLELVKVFFTLGFAAVVCTIISAPVLLMNMNSPFFWPVYAASWVVAIILFVWYIIKARRWKLPNGRTSLEADRDQQPPP